MTSSTKPKHVGARTAASAGPKAVARIAAGVDGYPEGRDAAAMGAAIAHATGAELMLVEVDPTLPFPAPTELSWKSLCKQAEADRRSARDTFAPGARIVAATDLSVPRALHDVVRREHRDLLVLGSSRQGPEGHVRIGKRTA